MRTTVVLHDTLVAEAKRLAADRNTTLSEIINEALRERLARPAPLASDEPFRMPVFQGGRVMLDTHPVELLHVAEDDDLQPFRE